MCGNVKDLVNLFTDLGIQKKSLRLSGKKEVGWMTYSILDSCSKGRVGKQQI